MNPNDVSEFEAIRFPIMLYNSAVDRGAYFEFVNVFTPDATVIICGDIRLEGRQAIIDGQTAGAKLRGAYEEGNMQRHNLGNSMINVVDSDHARALHYIQVTSELGHDHSGVYIDDLVREEGRWWIAKRRSNLEWARPDSRFFRHPGKVYMTPRSELDIGLYQG